MCYCNCPYCGYFGSCDNPIENSKDPNSWCYEPTEEERGEGNGEEN